ncbi:type II toxin-antitoxin system VapC family toxin [Candidatus Bathyarchaeota archaeon]|nr:type II toxin-antitoxin system VapC family toxin [Candidatus Bathyarchaeota archaeon]MBS7629057.1 type II toxin-antitoxin system VapC family toxin [Candidatus Bathyarchaeota archaeon]
MSYILDSSAIFEAVKSSRVETVSGNYTLELARYELGNTLWKEYSLYKKINSEELKQLIILFKKVFNLVKLIELECCEEKILDVAERLRITFYDASYVFFAQERGIPLITEDEHLINRVGGYIKTLRLQSVNHT